MNRAELQRIQEIQETYNSYKTHWAEPRDQTEKAHRYLLGDQWDRTDIAQLTKAGMPYYSKNILLPIVNKFTGIERENRSDIVVVPAEDGIEEVAEGFTRLNYHFFNNNKFKYKQSDWLLLAIIGNLGSYVRPYFTTEFDPLGSILFNVISGMNVLKDPGGKKYDLEDSVRLIYTTWWTKDEALRYFPDKEKELKDLERYRPGLWELMTRKTGSATDFRDDKREQLEGRYRVIEMWSKVNKYDTIYFNPENGQNYKINNPEEIKKLRFLFPDLISRRIKSSKLSVDLSIGNNVLLRTGLSTLQNRMPPFIPLYPYFFDGEILGILHNCLGYQDEHNKMSTSILHIINTTANSGWLIKKNTVNKDHFEEEGASTGFVAEWSGEKPEKITPNDVPTAHAYMDEQAKRGLYETSGLGENLLGRKETERESGVLFESRVREGYTMLQGVFDNFSYSKDLLGEYLIWMYQNILPEEKIVQILTEEGVPEREPINRMVAQEIARNRVHGKYNVVTDNVAQCASAKERQDRILYTMAKIAPPDLIDWATLMETAGTPKAMKMAEYARQKMAIVNQAMGIGAPSEEGPENLEQMSQ